MKRFIFAISLLGILFLAAPAQPAMAFDLFQHDCNSDSGSATVCKEKGNTANPLTGCKPDGSNCGNGLLMNITNIIAYIAGAAAIIIIIVGGIRYITSGSDTSVGSRIDDDVLNAKRSIVQALIGLAVVVLAKTIITYVLRHVN